MKFFLKWVFRDAILVREKAIKSLQRENRELALEIALLKAKS